MLDINLLRIMRTKKDYNKLVALLPHTSLDPKTSALVADFGKYFEKHPNHDKIDVTAFLPCFKRWHPTMKDEQFIQYTSVMRNAMQDVDHDVRANIISELSEVALMTALANIADEYNEGELPNAFEESQRVMMEHKKRLGLKGLEFIDTPIGELLKEELDDSGIRWRLNCLNESMRGLRPGDFGIVAGRPDKGKTTFLTSECTAWAPQLAEDRNIVWLNNEGPGRRIIPRLYQSALGYSMPEMKAALECGTLTDDYREAIGGRLDKIRVIDIHGATTSHVETILEENNPGVVIYDMIDNIRGFGGEARTDLALEEMYKWARERSVMYDCVGVATSQISNDGDGEMFPTLGMLKDSKTGKQGACDFQLMIGASNDPAFAMSRFMGLPKNKLRRPDGPSDPRAEVKFDGVKARYSDIEEGTE